jgi:hypothetical protein
MWVITRVTAKVTKNPPVLMNCRSPAMHAKVLVIGVPEMLNRRNLGAARGHRPIVALVA